MRRGAETRAIGGVDSGMTRLLCALLLVGCTAEPAADSDVTSDQVAAYRGHQRQLEIVAAQYDAAMAKSSAALCISVHRTYNREARDILERIAQLDPPLDAATAEHGGSAFADLACTTARITVDLDYHGALACQETAFADNQAEAARHLIALGALVEHATARIDEISAGVAADAETWTWSLPSGCSP